MGPTATKHKCHKIGPTTNSNVAIIKFGQDTII